MIIIHSPVAEEVNESWMRKAQEVSMDRIKQLKC